MRPEIPKIENSKSNLDNYKEIKPENKITLKDAKEYVKNYWNEFKTHEEKSEFGVKDVDYEEGLNKTPVEGKLGHYEGNRGESKFIPADNNERGKECCKALKEKGLDGIEYKNAEPDFSGCAEATISIDHMTENRADNFTNADKKLAEKWNNENKDNRKDWSEEKINEYRKEHNLSWHERCDTEHMDLVDKRIHGYCTHSGGVAECKARNNLGGIFDE